MPFERHLANNLNSPTSIQPDLEEFLSALSGFLNKQNVPTDPGHLRFLEIFFRTVKSDKGHLLRISESGQLQSMMSIGMDSKFDENFNEAHAAGANEPCPLDMAFLQKEPIAIVDLSKDPDIPKWFSTLMNKYEFASLVAIPLMGITKPVGILCAYYQDICLFDQATLGHLMMIGRMVGMASEKSLVADQAQSTGERGKSTDQFLKILVSKSLSKTQIYSLLAKVVGESIPVAGLVCGPLVRKSEGLVMTVAGGVEMPSSAMNSQVNLPVFLTTRFISGLTQSEKATRSLGEWGDLKSYVNLTQSSEISRPLVWQNRAEGAIVAWRDISHNFSEADSELLTRLVDISTIALHAAG